MRLNDKITQHFRLVERQKRALEKLGLFTIRDLLYHLPFRYENFSSSKYISDIKTGEEISVYGKIVSIEKRLSWKTKKYIVEAVIEDSTGKMKLMWFNQVYIEKMLQHHPVVKATGKNTGNTNGLIVNPVIEILPAMPEFFENREYELMPIYHESQGISSRWFFYAIKKTLSKISKNELQDPIPPAILKKYSLPKLDLAIFWAHLPQSKKHTGAASKRFAFEEVFVLQLSKEQSKINRQKDRVVDIAVDKTSLSKLSEFQRSFGFTLTSAQVRATKDIVTDFKKPYPVARLLEGDVGSGKTAVAASAAFLVLNSKSKDNKYKSLQTAYMTPTEILAGQIFEDFISLFSKYQNIKIGLITSSGCKIYPSKTETHATKISCPQLKKWIKEGIIPIVIGTHSLIFKSVEFENLAFVIVDEQHRFGTMQRAKLSRKDGANPYFLSMTATPIPRTLALTIYGDLELSMLDELPKGRKNISTKLINKRAREKTYDFIKRELQAGHQAYVICPRIEEADPEKANALRAKSVEEELRRLSNGPFKEYKLLPLHGKMTQKEKEENMKKFATHKADILVATSVVEVGVNVPNATCIIIEGAERFGLSQLHQLRGRVRRAEHRAYCFLFTESNSKKTSDRLSALTQAKDGFELAEYDLKLRGPGDLYGSKQWGLSDIGMQALQNLKMVEYARKEAQNILKKDPELKKVNQTLKEKVQNIKNLLHLE